MQEVAEAHSTEQGAKAWVALKARDFRDHGQIEEVALATLERGLEKAETLVDLAEAEVDDRRPEE